MADSDDEAPQLSLATLALLQEFYTDRETKQQQFEELKEASEEDALVSMDLFPEDWQASQFWYTEDTAQKLAEAVLEGAGPETVIGIVSAPTAFVQLRKILAATVAVQERPKVYLFEFDRRFEYFKDFVFYDYNKPTNLPPELKGRFDRIICDPPFLNEDCQTKAALTVRWLLRPVEASPSKPLPQVLLCTGERMGELVLRLYRSYKMRTTTFDVKHAKGLSNEFRCYATVETKDWTWRA